MVLGLALRCKAPGQLLFAQEAIDPKFKPPLPRTLSDTSLCQREFPRPLLRLPVIAGNVIRIKV
jgi:hypothetical protein